MYEFIENLEQNEYEKFVLENDKAHFMQSYNWGLVQKEKHFKPYYTALKKDGVIVASALLLEKKILRKYGYLYCPRGYIIDYNNNELVKEFTNNLKRFMKSKNDIFIRMDPDIKLHSLDIEGNIIEGVNNTKLVDYLKSLGYKHKGFNKNFENNQPRYTFRLNIDKPIEEVYSGFHATTRKILNKGNLYELEIIKDSQSLDDFYITMEETAKKEHIIQSSYNYYKNFYEILNKNNMSNLYTIRVNTNKLKEKYLSLINEAEDEIKKTSLNKNQEKANNLINDLNIKLSKLKESLNELNNIKDEVIPLSSIITAKYKDTVWTVHGGNHNLLKELNANYLLYYEIIKDANKEGYKRFDFFGTTGDPNPHNSVYGIHLFKKRFGGEYTEFIGEFDLINKKLLYFLYNKYLKFKKRKKLH